jgi:protein-disulfide isomerase
MDSANEQELSRKDRRELRRAQQGLDVAKLRRNRLIRRVLLWTGGVLVLVGLAWGMGQLVSDVPAPLTGGVLAVPPGQNDHGKGPEDAPLVLVEYSDLQCPACAYFQPILKKLTEEPELAGKIRLVFRNFPLRSIHPNAQQAAQAVEAAHLQGKFWEMHDLLFERQARWSGLTAGAARTQFIAYAGELGLDVAKFERDLTSDAVRDHVAADVSSGELSGVSGTPTFYLNGIRTASFESYEEFKKFFTDALPK